MKLEDCLGRVLQQRLPAQQGTQILPRDLCFAKVKICKSVDIIHEHYGPYRRHNLSDHPGQLTNGFRELTVKVVFTIIKEKLKYSALLILILLELHLTINKFASFKGKYRKCFSNGTVKQL